MLKLDELKKVISTTPTLTIQKFIGPLNEYMPKYGINTLLRVRHFLAQIIHESGAFFYVEEIASGKYYEGRKDLGNIHPGDGVKFKGRGLIQITGRANYSRLSTDMFNDQRLIDYPEILKQPACAVESACWFWKLKGLNQIADRDDILTITKKINGWTNGLQDRKMYYQLCNKFILTI